MANYESIAKQLVEFYYTTFDANREQLKPLYRGTSMMTFESSQVAGVDAITTKLQELPFQKVKHIVATLDAQPSLNGSILVQVTGKIKVDDGENDLNYSQTFHLAPDAGAGGYYVHNDIFKLIF